MRILFPLHTLLATITQTKTYIQGVPEKKRNQHLKRYPRKLKVAMLLKYISHENTTPLLSIKNSKLQLTTWHALKSH